MKKYYLISSKEDDYGACKRELFYGNKSTIKDVYHYIETQKEELEILKKYFDVANDYCETKEELEEYLETYY